MVVSKLKKLNAASALFCGFDGFCKHYWQKPMGFMITEKQKERKTAIP